MEILHFFPVIIAQLTIKILSTRDGAIDTNFMHHFRNEAYITSGQYSFASHRFSRNSITNHNVKKWKIIKMKISAIITRILALATVAKGATSTMTEMALREYQANSRLQSARQKMLKSSYRRRPSTARRIPAGSAMSLNELLELIASAQKAADKRRRQLKMYSKMLEITNSYKN